MIKTSQSDFLLLAMMEMVNQNIYEAYCIGMARGAIANLFGLRGQQVKGRLEYLRKYGISAVIERYERKARFEKLKRLSRGN